MMKKLKQFIKQMIYEWTHYFRPLPTQGLSADEKRILKLVDEYGVAHVPNFFSAEKCQQLVNNINRHLGDERINVWKSEKTSGDKRIYGANQVDELIGGFYTDPGIHRMICAYERSENYNGFTMAARLDYLEGNKGSGEGWHRDRADAKQTKAIVYLCEVNAQNGPFQYIYKSHKPLHFLKDYFKYGSAILTNRMSEELVNKIVEKEPDRLKEFHAGPGTLLFVDTRGIHRGKPIEKGQVRFALTNYYWFDSPIPHHILPLLQNGKKTASDRVLEYQ